jgi:transcriptional regulator with XRE-family HTH domain
VEHVIRLTVERKARGISTSALARRAEMHLSSVTQIETGRLKAFPGQVRKLALALEWPADRADELFRDVD